MRAKFTLICISLSLILFSCGFLETPERMFKIQVLDTIPKHVSNIRYFKDKTAMHGPMFFRLSSSKPGIITQEIIKKHSLKQMTVSPEGLSVINHLAINQVDWWKPLPDLSKMSIYAISYVPKSGSGDFHLRCLFVDGKDIFFMTTGFFRTEEYHVQKE